MLNTIKIMSRDEIEKQKFSPDGKIFISITDPNSTNAKIFGIPENKILRLSFYDIDKDIKDSSGKLYAAMDVFQAKRVAKFIENWVEDCNTLIVHCEAGVSRSAAIGAAIAHYYLGSEESNYIFKTKIPNRHVYNLVLLALHELNSNQ